MNKHIFYPTGTERGYFCSRTGRAFVNFNCHKTLLTEIQTDLFVIWEKHCCVHALYNMYRAYDNILYSTRFYSVMPACHHFKIVFLSNSFKMRKSHEVTNNDTFASGAVQESPALLGPHYRTLGLLTMINGIFFLCLCVYDIIDLSDLMYRQYRGIAG